MLHLHPPVLSTIHLPFRSSPISIAVLPSPAALCLQHLVCRAGCSVLCRTSARCSLCSIAICSGPTTWEYIPILHSQQTCIPPTSPSQRHKAVAPCTIPMLFHFPAAASLITSAARTHQPTSLCRTRSRKAASTSSCAHFPSTAFLLGAPRNAGCCWDRSWVQLCSTAELMCLVGVQVPELTRCWGGFQVRSCALVQDGEVEFA